MTDSCGCGKIPEPGKPFVRGVHCLECTRRKHRAGQTPKVELGVIRPVACIYLGKILSRARCACPRKDWRNCDAGLGKVQQFKECETCDHYVADD